jgi:hypothetical protein
MKCTYLVTHEVFGRCAPRPCKRDALEGSVYCGGHAVVARRRLSVEVREGNFCVWCASPGRAFVRDGVAISLCTRCAQALVHAIDRASSVARRSSQRFSKWRGAPIEENGHA